MLSFSHVLLLWFNSCFLHLLMSFHAGLDLPTSPERRRTTPGLWCRTWAGTPWLLCSTLWWWSCSAPAPRCPENTQLLSDFWRFWDPLFSLFKPKKSHGRLKSIFATCSHVKKVSGHNKKISKSSSALEMRYIQRKMSNNTAYLTVTKKKKTMEKPTTPF